MASATDGAAIPVYVGGRRGLLFDKGRDRAITLNFQITGRWTHASNITGFPRLLMRNRWRIPTTIQNTANAEIQIAVRYSTIGVGAATWTTLTRYINRNVTPTIGGGADIAIATNLTSDFSGLAIKGGISIDVNLARIGRSASDNYDDDIYLLNSTLSWRYRVHPVPLLYATVVT